VLVNKSDGIDALGKACELLILDVVERREAIALPSSPAWQTREVCELSRAWAVVCGMPTAVCNFTPAPMPPRRVVGVAYSFPFC
jgi:hypothetical protein